MQFSNIIKALMRIYQQRWKMSDRIFPFTVQHIRRRIKSACHVADLGDGFSGHSIRVFMAQELAATGTESTSLMNAGRWTTSRMPARYTREQETRRGTVARYYGMGRQNSAHFLFKTDIPDQRVVRNHGTTAK